MAPPPPEAACRICFNTAAEAPEAGRLLSPCRCRGTSKYVHSDCLRQWRLTAAGRQNFYECPTCKYKYKLRRLGWSEWIGGTALQLGLTITILWATIYILGFVADPLLDMYASVSKPYYEYSILDWFEDDDDDPLPRRRTQPAAPVADPVAAIRRQSGLIEHLMKGLSALGLLGFLKVVLFLGPSGWYNFRSVGRVGRRPGAAGRDRIGWLAVAIGVGMFLMTVWKKVNQWVSEWLEKIAERVLDIEEEEQEQEDARRRAEGVPLRSETETREQATPKPQPDETQEVPSTPEASRSRVEVEEEPLLSASAPGGWVDVGVEKEHQD